MTGPSVEDDLGELLIELAESRSVATPAWESVADRRIVDGSMRGRQVLVAAVAAAALILVAGVVVVSRRPSSVSTGPATPAPESIEGPALLAPGVDGPAVSASELRSQQTVDEHRGALAGPSGTIYSLDLAVATDEEIPGEQVDVAGFEAIVLTDGSAPTQIYRTVDLGCLFLTITTADAPALSSELAELVESMTVDGINVTIDPQPGWTSFGSARPVELYMSTLQVQADDGAVELFLQQSPGSPIGYYLFGETAPVLLASDGIDQLWHVAGATTPGINMLIGTRFDTAFRLSGEAPVDVLRSVVETFAAAEEAEALPPSSDAETTEMSIETGGSIDQNCQNFPPVMTITN